MAARWERTANRPDEPDDALRPVLFVDRDGVLVVEKDYLGDPAQVELFPGVGAALRSARAAGFTLIGLSNQSGIGRGYFGEAELDRVMQRLDEMLAVENAALDGFFYCPHHPEAGCRCRKPAPGLLEEAAAVVNRDTTASWMVGDKFSDVALGRDAGMGAVLVRTGYGARQEQRVLDRYKDDPLVAVADDLAAAVDLILRRRGGESGR